MMMNLMPFANIFGVDQWIIVFVVVLMLFGGSKIPELMRGVGRGVGELQKGLEDGKRMLHNSIQESAAEPAKVEAAVEVKPIEAPVAEAKPAETKPVESPAHQA